MILETIASTIFWNSSSRSEINSAFVHAAASPIMIENTRALITGIICGIDNSNTAAGSSFNPSAVDEIDKCGISAYPAAVENKAAPTDEEYAIVTAIRSSLDAFLPICVIEGAINAIIISGMQKLIIWLRIYFSVTTIFNMAFENALPSVELSTSPITTPARTPTISLNGRLFQKLVFFIK